VLRGLGYEKVSQEQLHEVALERRSATRLAAR
jgi:hypothetical protein